MSLDPILERYRSQVGQWLDQARHHERKAEEARVSAKMIEQRIAGILEAAELLAGEGEQPAMDKPRRREEERKPRRSLTEQWKQIMALVDSAGDFDYDMLDDAARQIGHPVGRDTLRSQMSLYKASGLVEALGGAMFRMTDLGRKAAGIEKSEASDAATSEASDGSGREAEKEGSHAAQHPAANRESVGSNPTASAPLRREWGSTTSPFPNPNNPNPWRAA